MSPARDCRSGQGGRQLGSSLGPVGHKLNSMQRLPRFPEPLELELIQIKRSKRALLAVARLLLRMGRDE